MRRSATVSDGDWRVVDSEVAAVFRPDVYGWLVKNRREIETALRERRRPGWREVAAELTRRGFSKPDGSPVTAEYVRHTWWKVRRHLRLAAPVRAPAVAPPPPRQVVAPARPVPTIARVERRQFGFPTTKG